MKKSSVFIFLFICISNVVNAQWQPTTGIYGADVRCSLVNGTSIFIGTGNGVYLTTNNGSNWTSVSKGLPNDNVIALATNGANLYAGTSTKGVFFSTDNGQNWVPINGGLGNLFINAVIVTDGKLFAGTAQGLFSTANNGGLWVQLLNSPTSAIVANGTTMFAGTTNGVLKSTNSGANWSLSNTGFPAFERINCLAINGTKLLAGTSTNVFLSTDNGQNWTNIGFNERIFSVAMRGNTIFVGTLTTMFVSSDNGGSWQSTSDGLTKRFINSIGLNGPNLIVGTLGSVFFLPNNGDIWVEKNTGLLDNAIQSFATDGVDVYTGSRSGQIYKAPTNGNTWTNTTNDMPSFFNLGAITIKSPYIFASSDQGVFVSNNNGQNWSSLNVLQFSFNSPFAFTLATKGETVYAGMTNGVYVSTNNGASWAVKSQLSQSRILNLTTVNSNLYAINGSLSSTIQTVFLSTNNADSWLSIYSSSNNPLPNAVTAIGSNIFIGTAIGIQLSSNNGATWTAVNPSATQRNVTSFAVNGNTLYAGTTDGGIYLSNNNGTTWQAVNEGLSTKNITKLIIAGAYLYAGTDIGVFKRPLNELTVKNNEPNEVFNCTISPNPVSNSLIINTSDALIGKKYAINNILGETIKSDVLTNDKTELNVQNLAKGLYFLQIIGTNKTIKFVKE
jgi:ligand-binding sensor domain-containing protein